MTGSNKTILKSIVVLLVIMIALTSFRLLWLMYHQPSTQPTVQNGLLDLRNHVMDDSRTIHLEGDWAFYPEQLLVSPHETPATNDKEAFYRFGTYHVKIMVAKPSEAKDVYSVRIPAVHTASALYINGQYAGGSGVVSADPNEHRGKGNPYVVTFTAENQEIDMTLHISNFDTSDGIDMTKPIQFGTDAAVFKKIDFEIALLTGLVVILLLHSLYSILIYLFIYREKIILLFGVGFLLPAIDELITYNSSAMEWLHLNYVCSYKFKELIYLGAALFLVQIMRVLLANYEQYKQFRWFFMLYGVSAVCIIALPLNILLQVNGVFFLLYVMSFLYVIYLALKEYFEYRQESIYIAVIVVSTTSGILWGLVKEVAGIDIPFYPFDYLLAVLGFAVFWFKRFSRQNRQVVDLVDELKHADKVKDEFLTNSTNKLWNPLNTMTTIAQSLHDREPGLSTIKDKSDLKYLIHVGRSMSFVLNDLQDFTRLKEQMIQVHPKSTSVHAVISNVWDMLKYIAEGKDIKFTYKIPDHFPNVLADESRLIQVFFNILGNAVKYTYSGRVAVCGETAGGMAIIYVQDTGIGMDEETQEKVRSAYQQGVHHDEGMGLGLNVSEKLIELHGGSLEMKSEEGIGTKFIITLPLAMEQAQDGEVEPWSPVLNTADERYDREDNHADAKKQHILVVDDDPSHLRMIAGLFSAEEYRVVTVTSGAEALHLLDTAEWDLYIIDAAMPYMSGYALTEQIRERYSIIELPILLLTARSYIEDVNAGFTAGANDYVAKPINALELKSRSIALMKLKQSISEKQYMESAWLQAQIRPHFLFNTLNTIASLSEVDSDRMVILLEQFGEYLYGSFKEENLQQVIPIGNELELVKSYLYIENERFGDRIRVQWEVDDDLTIEIPPLSIQTLVENAVRHGILKKNAPGTICIRITDSNDFTTIGITDDGMGMDPEQVSKVYEDDNAIGEGIGLVNTNRRLKRLYGRGLKITSIPERGTTVEFTVTKKKAHDAVKQKNDIRE